MNKRDIKEFLNTKRREVLSELTENRDEKLKQWTEKQVADYEDICAECQMKLNLYLKSVNKLVTTLSNDPRVIDQQISISYGCWGESLESKLKGNFYNYDTSTIVSDILKKSINGKNDAEYNAIIKEYNEETSKVRIAYHNLYTRIDQLNGKKGTELLKGLGFDLSKYEAQAECTALVSPIDTEHLYIPVLNKKLENQESEITETK